MGSCHLNTLKYKDSNAMKSIAVLLCNKTALEKVLKFQGSKSKVSRFIDHSFRLFKSGCPYYQSTTYYLAGKLKEKMEKKESRLKKCAKEIKPTFLYQLPWAETSCVTVFV